MIEWVKVYHDAYIQKADADYDMNISWKNGTRASVLAPAPNTGTEHWH